MYTDFCYFDHQKHINAAISQRFGKKSAHKIQNRTMHMVLRFLSDLALDGDTSWLDNNGLVVRLSQLSLSFSTLQRPSIFHSLLASFRFSTQLFPVWLPYSPASPISPTSLCLSPFLSDSIECSNPFPAAWGRDCMSRPLFATFLCPAYQTLYLICLCLHSTLLPCPSFVLSSRIRLSP